MPVEFWMPAPASSTPLSWADPPASIAMMEFGPVIVGLPGFETPESTTVLAPVVSAPTALIVMTTSSAESMTLAVPVRLRLLPAAR